MEEVNTPRLVPLNTADSLDLIALRGVGPWVAGRILLARRRWGGFADTAQLVEALGWDSLARSIMPLFSCDVDRIERRCPDSLTVEGWSQCPAFVGARRRPLTAMWTDMAGTLTGWLPVSFWIPFGGADCSPTSYAGRMKILDDIYRIIRTQ